MGLWMKLIENKLIGYGLPMLVYFLAYIASLKLVHLNVPTVQFGMRHKSTNETHGPVHRKSMWYLEKR